MPLYKLIYKDSGLEKAINDAAEQHYMVVLTDEHYVYMVHMPTMAKQTLEMSQMAEEFLG